MTPQAIDFTIFFNIAPQIAFKFTIGATDMLFMVFRHLLTIFLLCGALTANAQDSANGLVYHGRVLKPNGDALEDANVNFTVRVYGSEALPTPKRCLLYEETHSGVNMTGTLGTFELKIGEGTRVFAPPEIPGSSGIGRLFLNSPSFTLTTTSCTAGTNDFTAESLDADRELEVTIQSGATVLNLPAQKLRAMPWAMQAMEIGGYSADYLAKLNAAVPNQMNAAALMYLSNNAAVNDNGTPTNYSDDTVRLQNLINPTNPQDAATKDYVDTAIGAGFTEGNGIDITTGVISTKVDNTTIEFDGTGIMRVKALGIDTAHLAAGSVTAAKLNQMGATSGQVLKWNGSAWAPDTDNDTATTYTAGDGLTLTANDFDVNVDTTTISLNGSDQLQVSDGGIGYVKLNSAGGTVNEGLLVKDSSGRIFNLQCAANQVANWTMSNGWECIDPSSLVGVQSTTLTQNNIWVGNASNVAAAQALPTCGANQYITYNGTAWSCATDVGSAGAVASAQGTAAVKVNGDNAAHTGAVTISVDDATVAAKGLMQVGNGLQVAAGVVSVSAPTCTAGQYISYNGTTWACSAPTDNDTTYTAGDALTLTGNDFDVAVDNTTVEVNADALRVKALGIDTAHLAAGSVTAAKLNQMGAANNEILKWNGSAWAPAADAGITAVAGQPLNQHQVWLGNVSNVAAATTLPNCGANQVLKYDNASGFTCQNDAGASGTVADISSTAPVKVNGGTTAQTGSVTVSVDDATASTKGIMQVGTGLSVSSGTVSVDYTGIVQNIAGTPSIETGTFGTRPAFGTAGRIYIASDTNAIYRDTGSAWVLIGDGTGTGDVTASAPLSVTNSSGPNPNVSITAGGATGDVLQWNGSAWANNTVTTCTAGQYLSFDGTTWSCTAPTGTTYTAGDGLTLTANDFDVNVDTTTISLNGSDQLQVSDGGIGYAKLNSAGGTVNEGMLVKDSSGRIFQLQCAGNQVPVWSVSNGWECINPASLAGVGTTTISGGTQNYLAKFNATGDNVVNSTIFENGGKVGIGTASPSYQLHIQGSSNDWTKGSLYLRNTNAGAGANTNITLGNSDNIDIATFAVGSGVNPRTELTGQAGLNLIARNGGTDIRFMAGGQAAEKMRIDSTGNVGIGTATPTAKLHLPAGTTAASTAPLKFEPTSATLMSTPENGAMEFDGTDYYLTAGGSRKKIMASTGGTGDYVAKSGDTMTGNLTIQNTATGVDQPQLILNNLDAASDKDVYVKYQKQGTNKFSAGYDAGVDRFSINGGGAIDSANSNFSMDTSGNLRISNLVNDAKSVALKISHTPTGINQPILILNETSAASDKESSLSFQTNGTGKYTMGYDTSNDSFSITAAASLTGADVMTIKSGNVGIGVTSPYSTLSIGSASNAAVSDGTNSTWVGGFNLATSTSIPDNNYLATMATAAGDRAHGLLIKAGKSSESQYVLRLQDSSGVDIASVQATGRVGIGNSSPATKFTVGSLGNTLISDGSASVDIEGINANIGGATNGKYLMGLQADTGYAQGLLVRAGRSDQSQKLLLLQSIYPSTVDQFVVEANGNANINGNLTVGSASSAADKILTITGQNDAAIKLVADTDNAGGENHNSYIQMSQDNGGTDYIMGITGTSGTTPNETALSGALSNTLFIGTNNVAGNIQFATGGSGGATYGVRMTILDDGKVGIGTNAPSEALDVTGNVRATSFISTSDRRLKTNIRAIAGMSAINQLRGVQYEWRADGTSDAGVIAQEVEKIFPNAVRTDEVTGYKAVKYNYLIAPLIEATKENYNMCKQSEAQIQQIQRSLASLKNSDQAQNKELQALRAENAALKKRLDLIEKKLGIK